MKCKDIKYRLPEFIKKTLSEAENSSIGEHLTTCEECLQELKGLEQLYFGLNSLKETPPPDHYWTTLLPRIHMQIEEQRQHRLPRWIPRYAIPAAIAALLLIVLPRVISPQRGEGSSEQSTNVGSSFGVRALLQQMDSIEIQQISEMSSISPFNGFVDSHYGEHHFNGDKEVLKQMFSENKDLYTAQRVDLSTIGFDIPLAVKNLNDREINDIILQLNQKQFIN